MPVDNSPEKLQRERERMRGLVQRLRHAAAVSSNFHMAAELNEAWMELERLLALAEPQWSELDLAIVRAKVLLDRAHSP